MILSDLESQGMAEFMGLSYVDLITIAKTTKNPKTLKKLMDYLSVRIFDYNANIQMCQTVLYEARKTSLKLTGNDPALNWAK